MNRGITFLIVKTVGISILALGFAAVQIYLPASFAVAYGILIVGCQKYTKYQKILKMNKKSESNNKTLNNANKHVHFSLNELILELSNRVNILYMKF